MGPLCETASERLHNSRFVTLAEIFCGYREPLVGARGERIIRNKLTIVRPGSDRCMSTRQYARLVVRWVTIIGLDPSLYGTIRCGERRPR
jgi:hypothetical protein